MGKEQKKEKKKALVVMVIRGRGPLTISDTSNLAKPPSPAYLAADMCPPCRRNLQLVLPALPCVANAQSKLS